MRTIAAYGVHLLTASGVVWGYLAIHAMARGEWRSVLHLMVLAILIDGFDGFLARAVNVKKYAAVVDGALLDNIVDYFNYVIVAVFFIHYAGLVPTAWELPISVFILLTSLYQFSQVNAKSFGTDEHFFLGFPDYWNIAVMYMLVLETSQRVNAMLLVVFGILIFVPIRYLYPSREARGRRWIMAFTVAYALLGVWGIWMYPKTPIWVYYSGFLYIGYYLSISLFRKKEVMTDG